MSERSQYVIVRYVPNVVRDEAVNIGVIIRGVGSSRFDFKFLPRGTTIRKISPEADQQLVKNFERQLSLSRKEGRSIGIIGHPTEPEFFVKATREFNGNLQLTEPRGIVAADLNEALHRVYGMYVAEQGASRPINYQAIAPYTVRERLWLAFDRGRLIKPGFVKKEMTVKGKHARWTFDLGYQNGGLKLISSVALNAPTEETNLGRALVFKGMLDDVRHEVEKVRGTAVVQLPKPKSPAPGAKEAQEFLKDSHVHVVDLSNVGELVASVQRDLAD
jgi:hypothetical protein